MHTRIIAWSFGLIVVSSLAGCGCGQELRYPSCICNGCTAPAAAVSPTVVRHRKAPPPATIVRNTPPPPIIETVRDPVDVETPEAPIIVNKKAEDASPPVENTLVPIPIPSQDSAQGTPATVFTETEDPLPKSQDQDKIVAPVNEAKPTTSRFVVTEKINSGNVDLANVLDRLAGGKEPAVATTEKRIPLQSQHISYSQTENYQELTGQLQQWRKTWRLRYAAVGAEETHGGSVVLEGIGDPSKLRDGQHLRVRGRLIPSDNRQESPRYVVQSIEMLD